MSTRRQNSSGLGWSRRRFLTASRALVAWPVLSGPAASLVKAHAKLAESPFSLGVASGDPTPDGVVLWTRLAPKPLEGGGMPRENVAVDWQIADDDGFTKIAASGTAVATPDLAHTVHVEARGLRPDRWYFYRFRAAGETSPIGRTRTAPAPDALVARLRFAFASCQHFETGLYTAWQHAAREDLDLIAHLGDYIYEYGTGTAKDLVRHHVGKEIVALDDYRTRLAQYKTDADLQAAHALCPWIVTWDDHEFDNNCANDISEERNVPREKFLARRAASYQAYYEHMPLRAAQLPKGPDMPLYRVVKHGRLAEFAVLDTRQYRTDQPCGDGNKPPCPEVYSENATLLGAAQEKWLYDTLDASSGVWNVLAQQVMMARVDRKAGDEVHYSMDQWPGYEANRQRVLKYFARRPEKNQVVITGDIHSNWANNLQVDSADERSPVVATEFVGTSISSGGNGQEGTDAAARLLAENPFVKFHNQERGYVSCEITPEKWTTHYRTVPYVKEPGAPLVTRKSFEVEAGRPGLEEV